MQKHTQKVTAVAIFFIFLLIFSACGTHTTTNVQTLAPLLRLHIRANSNQKEDQAVKLLVRDKVSVYLEKELAFVSDFATAKTEIQKRLGKVAEICDAVLKNEGFSYKSSVTFCNEFFPVRSYEGLVVESGYYDAVIIALGTGAGDNWWCVIYPPLCYLEVKSNEKYTYKSKIAELIEQYFGKKSASEKGK